ncbi:MAG: hypothetical protein H0V86_04105 [Chloroflexia bacterium]|nr:hypothetical protein [Chloroflexia bacterium]
MSTIRWAAIPIAAITLLLVAVAAVALRGADRSVPRQDPPQQAARQAPSAAKPVSHVPAKQAAPVVAPQTKAVAARPARQQQAASGKPQSVAAANNLGWRLGTEWTVVVEEYADYLAEAQTVTVTYRYKVVAVDAAKKSFTVSMRFADPANQPANARGDLIQAGYAADRGSLKLSWLQPHGRGSKLRPADAELLMGNNTVSMDVASSPFSGGKSVATSAASLGKVQGNRATLGKGRSATYAKGAPWWVSYSQGDSIKAKLISFKR